MFPHFSDTDVNLRCLAAKVSKILEVENLIQITLSLRWRPSPSSPSTPWPAWRRWWPCARCGGWSTSGARWALIGSEPGAWQPPTHHRAHRGDSSLPVFHHRDSVLHSFWMRPVGEWQTNNMYTVNIQKFIFERNELIIDTSKLRSSN